MLPKCFFGKTCCFLPDCILFSAVQCRIRCNGANNIIHNFIEVIVVTCYYLDTILNLTLMSHLFVCPEAKARERCCDAWNMEGCCL